MTLNAPESLRRTHLWFESNSGWSPPDAETLADWMTDGLCRCPDDCLVAPTNTCEHGLASWWLVLRTLDEPKGSEPLSPMVVVPHPDRLATDRPDYIDIVEAHHRALLDGDAGYLDPASGLFVLTARTLWNRGSCCQQGCRHCPFLAR
jgi:hypothetical protein